MNFTGAYSLIYSSPSLCRILYRGKSLRDDYTNEDILFTGVSFICLPYYLIDPQIEQVSEFSHLTLDQRSKNQLESGYSSLFRITSEGNEYYVVGLKIEYQLNRDIGHNTRLSKVKKAEFSEETELMLNQEKDAVLKEIEKLNREDPLSGTWSIAI